MKYISFTIPYSMEGVFTQLLLRFMPMEAISFYERDDGYLEVACWLSEEELEIVNACLPAVDLTSEVEKLLSEVSEAS